LTAYFFIANARSSLIRTIINKLKIKNIYEELYEYTKNDDDIDIIIKKAISILYVFIRKPLYFLIMYTIKESHEKRTLIKLAMHSL
jgi:hypothetical protein